MEMLTIAASPTTNAIRVRPALVYVNGRRRRDLAALWWEQSPAPQFGNAKLTVLPLHDALPARRIENVGALPPLGAEVTIMANRRAGRFRGFVSAHVVEADDRGERLVAEISHHLKTDLGEQVGIRVQTGETGPVTRPVERLRFNTSQDTLASEGLAVVNGRWTRIFDSSGSARRWTVSDALAYLLAAHVPADIEVPNVAELEALTGGIDLGALELTSLTAAEALMKTAGMAGMALRGARDGKGLVLYRPGRNGRRGSVRLQPAGSRLSVHGSNLWRGGVRSLRRPARRGVLAVGGTRQYESTFELSPGWDASLETARWRDFVRGESGNWQDVRQVYRRWVLNEHGWYDEGEPGIPTFDFTHVSEADFLFRIPRRFEPCLSGDAGGRSLGIVMEIKCGTGADWRRWTGPVWSSNAECAIYLGGDALPADYFSAAVAGEARVRVTATVSSDRPLTAEIAGDPNTPREVLDFSSRAAWRKVHETSVFFSDESLGPPGERDDAEMLERLAQRHAEALSLATEAELVLGRVDTAWCVGDIVERVDGRELELSGNPQGRPFVRSVRHDFTEQHTTTLIVSG